jgi:hypothetical protein
LGGSVWGASTVVVVATAVVGGTDGTGMVWATRTVETG